MCAILYFYLWPVRVYPIFLHYIVNGMVFGKKNVIEHSMCVLIFSALFV